jgi:hypothetical protein
MNDCRTEYGLSGSLDLNSDLLRYRAMKGKGGTVDMNGLRGSLVTELPTIGTSYTTGSSARSSMQKVQITKYDPRNIINTSSKTEWVTEDNIRSPNGGHVAVTLIRKTQGYDCAIGTNYWCYAPNGGGNFVLDLYWGANSTSGCDTKMEIYAWSNGWLQGTQESLHPETYLRGGDNSFTFSCNGTKKYITIIFQNIVDADKYYTQQYKPTLHGVRCKKI